MIYIYNSNLKNIFKDKKITTAEEEKCIESLKYSKIEDSLWAKYVKL